jgi:pimeloyl-ACP methyl ester carboxylesterase
VLAACGSRSRAEIPLVADRDRIKYAKSGDVSIAYVVSGDGPPDLVFFHGFTGNIEIEHEIHFLAAFLERLAGFSRLITFDRRGTGLSDRLREPATLEVRMDDLRACSTPSVRGPSASSAWSSGPGCTRASARSLETRSRGSRQHRGPHRGRGAAGEVLVSPTV